MGDQVIALEHKADGVVPVGVPVAVCVFFCGDAVDDQIAAVVAIQTADDVPLFAPSSVSKNGGR